MLKKSYFAFILLFLLALPISYSALSDGLVHVWTLNNTAAGLIDQINFKNLTKFGANYSSAGINPANSSNYWLNGAGLYMNQSPDNRFNLSYGYNYTLSFWVNFSDIPHAVGDRNFILGDSDTGNNFILMQWGTTSDLAFAWQQDFANQVHYGLPTLQKWHHFVITRTRFPNNLSQTMTIFLDGTTNKTQVWNTSQMLTNQKALSIELNWPSTSWGNEVFDEIYIWNRTLSDSEVLSLNSSFYPFISSIASFVSPTPNDTYRDTNVPNKIINVTCAPSTNAIIYFDSSATPTTVVANFDNVSFVNWTIKNGSNNYVDNTYYYFGSCNGTNTSIRSYTIDTISPTININSNNFFTSNNLSTVTNYNTNNVTANISITHDTPYLYGFEFNITYPNGTYVFGYRNESLNGSTFNYSSSINISSWAKNSFYNIDIWASDSHTTKGIPNWGNSKIHNGINFTPTNKVLGSTYIINQIAIYSDDDSNVTATKNYDRYNFEFIFVQKGKKKRTINIDCSENLIYLPNSNYSGHFICSDDPLRYGNWIDFVGSNSTFTVTNKNKKGWQITFDNLEDDITFHSIGGLNINHKTYQWYYPLFQLNSISMSQLDGYSPSIVGYTQVCRINATYINSSHLVCPKFSLYVNDILNYTTGEITPCQYSNTLTDVITYLPTTKGNISCVLNSLMGENGEVYTVTNSSTIQIYDSGLFNCTNLTINSTNATALNIIFRDENNFNSINSSIVGTILYANTSYTVAINSTNLKICIYPYYKNVSASMYFQYQTAYQERYYIDNITLTNDTQNIYLYNFQNVDATQLVITSYNYYYGIYPNIVGVLQRYYPAINSWIAVQNDKSDNQGQLIYYVYQSTTDYRIQWVLNGKILGVTDPMKFVCSSTPCLQPLTINQGENLNVYKGMQWTNSYNNVTHIYSLSWVDSNMLVSDVRLLVQKQMANGMITICDTTTNSSSGTILCDITGYDGIINIEAYRDDPDPFFSDKIDFTVAKLAQILKNTNHTEDGAILAFLLALACIGLGLAHPALGIISGIASYILIYFLGLMDAITLGVLTSIICLGGVILFMLRRGQY